MGQLRFLQDASCTMMHVLCQAILPKAYSLYPTQDTQRKAVAYFLMELMQLIEAGSILA